MLQQKDPAAFLREDAEDAEASEHISEDSVFTSVENVSEKLQQT